MYLNTFLNFFLSKYEGQCGQRHINMFYMSLVWGLQGKQNREKQAGDINNMGTLDDAMIIQMIVNNGHNVYPYR